MSKDSTTTQKSSYRDSLKSMDTEETFDLWFYRPIGYAWACLAKKLGITPNAITIAAIFLGIGAGIMFYYNNIWLNLVGVLLLVWANSFDSADGQLARMTKQYSRLGRILDGACGDIWFLVIYFAICFRVNATNEFFASTPWLIWTIAIIAGIFHAQQAALADYYRNFHLYFLKGEEGSELDSVAQINEKLAQLSWSKNFMQKLTLIVYANYTRNHERLTPSMQRLRAAIAKKWGGNVPSQEFRDAFRAESLPMMKYTNMLSFNTRTFALFTAILIDIPWLYFAFELTVLNIMLVYMLCCHERFCRRFTKEIEDGEY